MKREVIFSPEPLNSDDPSLALALRLGLILMDISVRFLKDAAFSKDIAKVTDLHVENLWRRMLTASGTTLVTYDRDRLQEKTPYLYMSNHLSIFDIPVLFGAIPPPLRMVAKSELLKIPVFGKALEDSGFIVIDRANPKKAIAQLEKAKEHLRNGISVWIAPEGTRKRDPTLDMLPFKKGGFHTAVSLEIPIVPVWVEGTERVMNAESQLARPNQTVSVTFGDPISTKGLKASDISSLMKQVRSAMLALSHEKRN